MTRRVGRLHLAQDDRAEGAGVLMARLAAFIAVLLLVPMAGLASELKATPDHVKQVLSGCWQALTQGQIDGSEPAPSGSADIVCFSYKDATIKVQGAGPPTSPADAGSYGFADDRIVLNASSGGLVWFWPNMGPLSQADCDVHLRSNGIVILSRCAASTTTKLNSVVLGRVATRVSGSAIKVDHWRQLQGCWSLFDRDAIWKDAPGAASGVSYCFDGPHDVSVTSIWSNGIVAWMTGKGDGEGLEEPYSYALSEGRLAIWYGNGAHPSCRAMVVRRARLILDDCDGFLSNGVYLGETE